MKKKFTMNVICDILYDNDAKTYQSGQTINAEVNVTFNSPTKCRCIFVKFIGEANVKWSKEHRHRQRGRRGHGHRSRTVPEFTAHEEYFNISRDVLRLEDGSEMNLQAKRYSNNVMCTLPPNLPSSLSGQFGNIRYFMRVFIDNMGRIDEVHESEFKVYTPLDLNQFPHLMQPKTLEMSKDFCFLFWQNGSLNISAYIPYTGFLVNSQVPIKIECENTSNVNLDGVKVYIKQITTFQCNDPKRETRTDEQQLCETKLDGVPKQTTKILQGVLIIPDLKSINLTNCTIIEVKHVLKMKGMTAGANANLFNEVPIILGNVPFHNFNYNDMNSMMGATGSNSSSSTVATHNGTVNGTSSTNEKECGPPPSYSDVVDTNSNVQIGWNSNM